MTRRVLIECTGYGQTGARYRVVDENGRVLVEGSRNPEFDVCRVLMAEGVRGRLEVRRAAANHPAMILDIEKAAGLTVVETASVGPKIVKWTPSDFLATVERDAGGRSAARPSFPT